MIEETNCFHNQRISSGTGCLMQVQCIPGHTFRLDEIIVEILISINRSPLYHPDYRRHDRIESQPGAVND